VAVLMATPPGNVPLGPLEEVAPEVGASPASGWEFWLLSTPIPCWMKAEEILDPSPWFGGVVYHPVVKISFLRSIPSSVNSSYCHIC